MKAFEPWGWVIGSGIYVDDVDEQFAGEVRRDAGYRQVAALLQEQLPHKRIQVQSHGVPVDLYRQRHIETALGAFPQLRNRDVVLCLGRIDPIKNQEWLLNQAGASSTMANRPLPISARKVQTDRQ